jgi:hypothetical protein
MYLKRERERNTYKMKKIRLIKWMKEKEKEKLGICVCG